MKKNIKINNLKKENNTPINYVKAYDLPCASYIGNDKWIGIDGKIYKVIG